MSRDDYGNVRCFHQTHHGDDYQGDYDFYGMEVKRDDLYLNVALRMAGARGFIYLESLPDMKAFKLKYFSRLPGHRSAWIAAQHRDGLHYIGFSYKTWRCFAFERGQHPRGRGYKHVFTGLVCRRDGRALSVEDFKAIALGFTDD